MEETMTPSALPLTGVGRRGLSAALKTICALSVSWVLLAYAAAWVSKPSDRFALADRIAPLRWDVR